MAGVFLSYRRGDASQDALRIHSRLADRFGDDPAYMDIEDIPLGVDLVDHITQALHQASYLLVAIALTAAGGLGVLIGLRVFENTLPSAEDFGEAIGAIVLFVVILIGLVILGLLIESTIAATYFARKLRLRSDEISRARGLVIAVVWLLGGLFTGVAFFAGLYLPEVIAGAV